MMARERKERGRKPGDGKREMRDERLETAPKREFFFFPYSPTHPLTYST